MVQPFPGACRTMKIAVLDDDPVQLEFISDVVEDAGYRATLFSRGQALISALRKDTFDMIIVDWNLPDRSGLEILTWARNNLKPRSEEHTSELQSRENLVCRLL